jgi:hypothetical protein
MPYNSTTKMGLLSTSEKASNHLEHVVLQGRRLQIKCIPISVAKCLFAKIYTLHVQKFPGSLQGLFNHSNNIKRREEIVKILVIRFSAVVSYFVTPTSR